MPGQTIPSHLASHYLAELLKVAAQLGVQVRTERLGDAETPVESGLAVVRGRPTLFLDPRLSDREKAEVAVRELSAFPLDGLYIKPALREILTTPE